MADGRARRDRNDTVNAQIAHEIAHLVRCFAPQASLDANDRLLLRFDVPVNANAAQAHGMAEVIYNVQASDDFASWTTIASKSLATPWSGPATVTVGAPGNGFVPVTVEDVGSGLPKRFLRLQAVFAP